MPYSALIVDGDAASLASLEGALRREFEVAAAATARQAWESLKRLKPDLLLLDPDLPDADGLSWLAELRRGPETREVPVLLMSLKKSEESVLQAFALGIDDYLLKPVDPRELLVRARTILRRRREQPAHLGALLSVGGVEIDPSQRRCAVFGRRVKLQPREFELLEILLRKAGRVLARPYLLETVWGMSGEASTRAVDVMISRLRRRLGRAGRRIETVSKMGYVFSLD